MSTQHAVRNSDTIYVTGANGQLGQALADSLSKSYNLVGVDLPKVDITLREQLFASIEAAEPDLVIHCAAYTNVDGCALEPGRAYRINALGTQHVALACQAHGIPMLHISTNEVFSGEAREGYEEWMPMEPINAYGRSKAAAEQFVRSLLPQHYIVRLAWLFAPGGRNFIHSIMSRAQTEGRVRVVTDEVGNPTYAGDAAEAIGKLIYTGQYGTYHLVNSGACSRWAFAREILRLAEMEDVPVQPIRLSDFKRPSRPPRFGALKNLAAAGLGITLRPWQEALAEFMREHSPAGTAEAVMRGT